MLLTNTSVFCCLLRSFDSLFLKSATTRKSRAALVALRRDAGVGVAMYLVNPSDDVCVHATGLSVHKGIGKQHQQQGSGSERRTITEIIRTGYTKRRHRSVRAREANRQAKSCTRRSVNFSVCPKREAELKCENHPT